MSRQLRVGVDARTLNVAHVRGTGRYIFELLRHTRPDDGIAWTIFGHDRSLPLRVPENFVGATRVFELRGHRFQVWEQFGLPMRSIGAGVDLLHCADNTAPVWQPHPTVVTIHDTVPWTETSADALTHHYLHRVQGVALRRCAAVITISESSRRDIVARWPELGDRLRVIPHGISDEYFTAIEDCTPGVLREALGGAGYLVYVGGPHWRKRFGWALELLERCGQPDLHLVAVGFGASQDAAPVIPAELRSRVHLAPFLSEPELVSVYRNAVATLYPTLYEGFGFPAVESQAAGTPVLFSPITSLEDLVGPLALPVDPQDMNAWLEALRSVSAMSAEERAGRAAAVVQWARRFSWRASVEAHLDVYRSAV